MDIRLNKTLNTNLNATMNSALNTAMTITLTTTQRQRLIELSAQPEELDTVFFDNKERDAFFKERETSYIRQNRDILNDLLENRHLPKLLEMEQALTDKLTGLGFTKVVTPTIITADMLKKMSLEKDHPLLSQVFWLDSKRCLRPMHAPNLYSLMGKLKKVSNGPVRIFEIGSCFRKESQGVMHLNEFTMLNLVELGGISSGGQAQRLEELAKELMDAAGISAYKLAAEGSEVYGETLDILVDGEEVASGASGPHPLDANWRIVDPWVGIGAGIERLTMIKHKYGNVRRVGRGLQYLDGARLNL